jgi:hypothetical protein
MTHTLFDEVILVHQDWVARFENFIKGIDRESFNPKQIGDDAICLFGRWLHANAGSFPDVKSFELADRLHQLFHRNAAEIAQALGSHPGGVSVRADLDKLHELSIQLVQVLYQVKAKTNRGMHNADTTELLQRNYRR